MSSGSGSLVSSIYSERRSAREGYDKGGWSGLDDGQLEYSCVDAGPSSVTGKLSAGGGPAHLRLVGCVLSLASAYIS